MSRMLTRAILIVGLLVSMLSVTASAAQDSKGVEFWLAFQQNPEGTPELSLFITGDTPTTGTVEAPGIGFSTPFTVTPGAVTTVVVPNSAIINTSDVVGDLGIHVTANAEVVVYGLNRITFTTDAYLGLPVDILGTEYIVLSYFPLPGFGYGSQFAIVGTEDGTTATIVPSVTVGTRAAGVPYVVNLDEGQTYQLHAGSSGDLTGTIITSDKPVSVFGSHMCANVPPGSPYCDHLVEQLTPTSTWGESFATMPLATRTGGDTFRFLASTDGTQVSVNGSVAATLNRGQFFEQIIGGPSHITSTKPILVAQYSNGTTFDGVTADPFMMLIPPYEQFLATYTVTTPGSGFAINYINVVAPNAAVGAITVDGVPIPAGNFTAIGSSGYSGAQVLVAVGTHNLAGPLPFGAFMYGYADYDSYGYPGGMALGEVALVTGISLTPETATNPVNTEHCVTAKVTDQNGAPLEGIRVDFSVTGVNAATGFSTTSATGEAQFCYTGTNTGSDTITSSVGTLSNTATKEWTSSSVDTTKPSCVMTSTGKNTEGKTYIQVTAQDTESGIASIVVTKSTNADTVVPAFTPGTTDAIIVVATKIIQKKASQVELR